MTCRCYCTAFDPDKAKPLTIAFNAVDATDSLIDPVERILDRVDAIPFKTSASSLIVASIPSTSDDVLVKPLPSSFPS